MKKFTFICIATIVMVMSFNNPVVANHWTEDWKINGITISEFENMVLIDWLKVGAGWAVSVFGTHTLGHIIWWEVNDMSWEMTSFSGERFLATGEPDWKNEGAGHAGFVVQLLGGTALKFSRWNTSWFATGYQAGTFGGLLVYNGGDFDVIDEFGGDSSLYRGIYTIWAGALFALPQ